MAKNRFMRKAAITAAATAFLSAFLLLTRLVAYETPRGFYAPVWSADGAHVYFFERETAGLVWGFGWEHISPPARAYVFRDSVRLQRLNPQTGRVETLQEWTPTPVISKIITIYRSRLFTPMAAHLEPTEAGVAYAFAFRLPTQPSATTVGLDGVWPPTAESAPAWNENFEASPASSDHVLKNGAELIAVRGWNGYPVAILAVERDGSYSVLRETEMFSRIYPTGVPRANIDDWSGRERIERRRRFRTAYEAAKADALAGGASETEASLQASERLKKLGYLPRGTRLVASRIDAAAPGAPVFEITEAEFSAGLFADIKAAIDRPGEEVEKSGGKYILHRDYDTSARLNEWLKDKPDRMFVKYKRAIYEIRIVRDS